MQFKFPVLQMAGVTYYSFCLIPLPKLTMGHATCIVSDYSIGSICLLRYIKFKSVSAKRA